MEHYNRSTIQEEPVPAQAKPIAPVQDAEAQQRLLIKGRKIMPQSLIAGSGIVQIRYRCNICPNGCELIDSQDDTSIKPVIHNHDCHRFPSLRTSWVLIKKGV